MRSGEGSPSSSYRDSSGSICAVEAEQRTDFRGPPQRCFHVSVVETRVNMVPFDGEGGFAGRKSPTEGENLNQRDVFRMKQDRVGHEYLEFSVPVCKRYSL